jgi:N-acetylmuramoyl-L-alanine amidase
VPPSAEPATTLPGVALAALPPTRLAREVLPLAVHRIVLDPGHGGTDLGTQAPNGLLEKDVTLDLARRLRELLVADGFEVHLTRDSDRRVSLRERAQLANRLPADAFLSIHLNWIEDRRRSRGVETYTLGPTDDPYLTQLASAENAESGYSRADVRLLLDRIYNDLRREESQAEALAVQHRLFTSLSQISPALEDRGVKAAPFLVLVATEMPAALAEVSCLSNDEEAARLGDSTYRDRIAQALRQGLATYARGPQKDQGKRSG